MANKYGRCVVILQNEEMIKVKKKDCGNYDNMRYERIRQTNIHSDYQGVSNFGIGEQNP